MQPFKMPDFYVPWPARRNPHLEAARTHSKAWAREIGILDGAQNENSPTIWTEKSFDRHDYALFCAYIHPETPGPELNLMADWNVWAFYVDDLFLKIYKQSQDLAGAKKYLDRVLLFMPPDLSSMPTPTNPTERGLADLWLRTAPSKSESWRRRILESTRSLLEASISELHDMNLQRLANPIEYIEMRRRVGGALWSADLVEHAVFVEIPERIANTRPMQVLKDTFADAVHLRNDIFSYQREVIKEGELTNGVLVIERFLNVGVQQAVNLVNDLLNSRLEQFDHTVSTELESLFEEFQLDAHEQANVMTYIRGLRDWQSGAHEWHIQTSRYLNPGAGNTPTFGRFSLTPTGLGTLAARITPSSKFGVNRIKKQKYVPYQKVGPTVLPEFYMPFTTRMNPGLDLARYSSEEWARQMGMLDKISVGKFIWDSRRFTEMDLAFFCSMAYPDVTVAQLQLNVDWMTWATYIDDYFPEVYGHIKDVVGAKILHARLSEFMPVDLASLTLIPLNPVERGLADLWIRTVKPLSIDKRRLFHQVLQGMTGSWVWELKNRVQNRIPEIIDYFEMRRKTSGSGFVLALPGLAQSQDVPSEVYRTRTMQELSSAAIDYVCLTNDIFSFQREIEFEGDIHNSILVVQSFLGCEKSEAIRFIAKLMVMRIQQFEHIMGTELPALIENFGLSATAREQLFAHVRELQNFMSGSLQWHLKTGRYKEIELRRSLGFKPIGQVCGLGTSAARILDTIRPGTRPAVPLPAQPETTPQGAKPFATSHLNPSFLKPKELAQAR